MSDQAKKKKKKKAIRTAIKRAILPFNLWKVYRLQRNRKKKDRAQDDAQLKLYAEILPKGFLHYGYFQDSAIKPEDISLNILEKAQLDYALKLLEHINDNKLPILDIGCGMGGLTGLLLEKGFHPVALTPDVNQVKYIREKYSSVEVIDSRFEDINLKGNEKRFGTLITSESLQYLKLDVALPLMDKLLCEGGRWIACDYFRIGKGAVEKSGHKWEEFPAKLDSAGFKIIHEEDITAHILPTIAYAHMWGKRLGVPLKDFIISKLQVKQPGLHFIMEPLIPMLNESVAKNMETINPETFAKTKKYSLMVMERK